MIPRWLQHPPIDRPIYEWWAADYDHVFVVYNPFFRVTGYHPETTHFGPTRQNASTVKELIELALNPIDDPERAPEDFDDTIKRIGQPIRWETIWHDIGCPDREVFDRTVWLRIQQVKRKDIDLNIWRALDLYCTENALYEPEDDQLPAILEPPLGGYLSALDISEVTLWDEWRGVSKKILVSALHSSEPCVFVPSEKTTAVAGEGFILSWAHEDVAGLRAVSDVRLKQCHPELFFECRLLGANEYSDVFNPVTFWERKPLQSS